MEPLARKTVRILVADDHDIICAGLERMIAAEPDMEVCGVAASGAEAVEKARIMEPDVLILDMNMSGLNGLDCAKIIRKDLPGTEVLLFTGLETDELMCQAFASGAKAFILKTDARVHLLDAIRSLARHKPYFTNKVSEVIFARLLRPGPDQNYGPTVSSGRLSGQELDLIRRIALGDSNRELAMNLGVNLRTAEGYRAALMRRMKFQTLADLVRYAVRNGFVNI